MLILNQRPTFNTQKRCYYVNKHNINVKEFYKLKYFGSIVCCYKEFLVILHSENYMLI